jgi:Zn-dependent protease with chaperone function
MATQAADRFISFEDYISQRAARGLSDDEQAPPYAHPIDGWILRTLESMPVKNVLDKAIDTYISTMMGRLLAEGVALDHRTFPELFDILTNCSKTLGIAVPHAVTGSWGGAFNAFTAGTDEYSFIFITDTLLKYFSREEAGFVIGHECGHIASKHMVYHTLVAIMMETALGMVGPIARILGHVAGMSLSAWSRRSEITCDRAGFICCGDLRVAERALIRLVTGFADADKVDVDDYLRKYKDISEFHSASTWQEALYSHPMIPKRIEALRLFARSELYFELTGKPHPEGMDLLTKAELDRLTNQLVKP